MADLPKRDWGGRVCRSPCWATVQWNCVHLDDLLGNMTPMEFILRFTFTHPDMDANIVGTINPAHLQDNLHALRQGALPPDLYTEAKRRPAAVGLVPKEVA